MAIWRNVNHRWAVSDSGRSYRIEDWYGRYDTPKGWLDLRIHTMPDFSTQVDLPAPTLRRWVRVSDQQGEPITEEDVETLIRDVREAYQALGGTCCFSEIRYVS